MRKHIITILFCMLAMVAAAQEDPTDNQSDGWTVPPIKIKIENTKQGKDSAKGKRKKKKDIPSFSRDRDAPLPEWRRPTAEECDTEKGKKKKGSIIYYTSMENFKTGKSEILTDVEMKDHSGHHGALYGGNDFKFKSDNDDADDILKKKALIVIMDDSLYVNCRKVRTSEAKFLRGYAHGYRYDSDKICFINEKIDDKKNVNSSAFFLTYMFGVPGAVATSFIYKDYLSNTVCYILDDDSGFVRTAEKGDFIDKLSKSGRSDLITWFKSLTSEQQETAYSVLLVMEELSLLRPN